MRLALLLITAGALAAAAQEVSVDLAGEWKMQSGDNPAMALPTFDDSGLSTFRLPTAQWIVQERWLRRWFELPANAEVQPLVITIGGFTSRYELFLNGARIAVVDDSSTFAQVRLFDVPPGTLKGGSRNLIALRVKRRTPQQGARDPMQNAGPFLVTSRVNAPVLAPALDFEKRLRRSTPAVGAMLVFGVLALLLFALWLGEVGQVEFLALALILAMDAEVRWREYFRLLDPQLVLARHALHLALSSAYAIQMLHLRFRLVWWAGAIPFLLVLEYFFPSPDFWTPVNWLLVAAVVVVVARHWNQLQGSRMLASTALVPPMIQILRTPSTFRPFVLSGDFGGYFIRTADIAEALLAVGMILLLVRRLISDRLEKRRFASELEAAREVQQLLIPSTITAGAEAVYLPAAEVGGDFWHFYDGQMLVVGDVSGKGLKAAMLVSLITGMLDQRRADSPAAVLAELNRALHKRLEVGFVTCCVVRLTEDGSRFTAANAGHPAPYLNGLELDLFPGLPLGVVAEAEYTESEFVFEGQLTLVSDGVVEAANTKGELFGFDRTREMSTKSANEIAEAARAWGQNDDITVVTVQRRRLDA